MRLAKIPLGYLTYTDFGLPFSKVLNGISRCNVTEVHQGPTFPQNLRPINLSSTTGKPLENAILKIVQRHI